MEGKNADTYPRTVGTDIICMLSLAMCINHYCACNMVTAAGVRRLTVPIGMQVISLSGIDDARAGVSWYAELLILGNRSNNRVECEATECILSMWSS